MILTSRMMMTLNLEFVPMVWESTGGATSTIDSIFESWSNQEDDQCDLLR